MILRTGLDLADIGRIRKAIANPRFLERVYTLSERERVAARGENTAAGLFAAKEAVAKALGTGFRGFCAWDIEVVYDSLGAPGIRLYRGALERWRSLGEGKIHISITHTAGMAAAMAILTDEKEDIRA